jgi:crossover junction endodeoxyribonuclease RusA
VTLELPWPPALNRYYRHVNGRTLLSRDGRAYRNEVLNTLLRTGFVRGRSMPEGARLRVEIQAHVPDRRRRDLDGMLKAVLDALTHARVYEDDSLIDDLRITRAPVDRQNPRLVLTLEAIS